ncbi:hypothetical protein X742_20385 [Mesorhizobium sp. LNHC232B00]|nr:hypothetical protein X742_20385 [Mesorhizobium sp. LNHC232B00]
MAKLFGLYPFLLNADGGYQGAQFQKGLKKVVAQVNVEIVAVGSGQGLRRAAPHMGR